jgi:hypothetical protein
MQSLFEEADIAAPLRDGLVNIPLIPVKRFTGGAITT